MSKKTSEEKGARWMGSIIMASGLALAIDSARLGITQDGVILLFTGAGVTIAGLFVFFAFDFAKSLK